MFNLIIVCFLFFSSTYSLSISTNPETLIRTTSASGFGRPEGVAFTPSGGYVAVVNSETNSVAFYKRIGEQGSAYETVPSFYIEGHESQLNFPHDVDFSPDGNHVAIANRIGNAITVYKYIPSLDIYDKVPIAVLSGERSWLASPGAVKYSPVENIIAVANANNTLCFFRYEGDAYHQLPYQVLVSPILHIPDGLSFSKDGSLLAVASHHSHSVVFFQRRLDSEGLYIEAPFQVLKGDKTNLCYPHSLSFHPQNDYLAVSNSEGQKNVNIFARSLNNSNYRYSNIPNLSLEVLEMYDMGTIDLLHQLEQEGGVKGIAFSPDGRSLAIVQNLPNASIGVMAIYQVSFDK